MVTMHKSSPRPVVHRELHTGAARERELLEAAQRGDDDAFGLLAGHYRGELHAHARKIDRGIGGQIMRRRLLRHGSSEDRA